MVEVIRIFPDYCCLGIFFILLWSQSQSGDRFQPGRIFIFRYVCNDLSIVSFLSNLKEKKCNIIPAISSIMLTLADRALTKTTFSQNLFTSSEKKKEQRPLRLESCSQCYTKRDRNVERKKPSFSYQSWQFTDSFWLILHTIIFGI